MSQSLQLLCSTGAFSRFPDFTGFEAVLEYGPQLDVDGFELMFYPGWYSDIDGIAATLRRSGLRFPAIHTEKNIGSALGKADAAERDQGVQRLADICRMGSLIGSQVLVLHLWNWPDLDDHLEHNLQALGACLDITDHYGQQLAVETIPGRHFDPLHNVHRAWLHDQRCTIALDTEFLGSYDQLSSVFEQQWLWQHDCVHHVHVKDVDGPLFVDGKRKYTHPGDGTIDFARFFTRLRQQQFTGNISLEAPAISQSGVVDIERLHTSLAFIRALL